MARRAKPTKTIRKAKQDLQRRAAEDGDTTLQDLRRAKNDRAGAKYDAKIGLEAAKDAYRGGRPTLTWTDAGRDIVRKMRATRTSYGRNYFVGEGDLCKVRRLVSKYETFNGYGTADLTPGEVIMITSSPYNPYGDGLRVDVLRGLDEINGVPLAKLVQLPREENN